jgi:hypothetical protein
MLVEGVLHIELRLKKVLALSKRLRTPALEDSLVKE